MIVLSRARPVPRTRLPAPVPRALPRQHARVHADLICGFFLRAPQHGSALHQAISPSICGWQGVVPEKPDDRRHVFHARLRAVAFPVRDARFIDTELFRDQSPP
jgi:hypothetical protein